MVKRLSLLLAFLVLNIDARQFVSLKSSKVNMRVGPGDEFPVSWVFTKAKLPMLLVAEFQQWRKVKFFDNTEGWIHQSMLSGRNTALVISDEALLFKRQSESSPVAKVDKNVIVRVLRNEFPWVKIEINKIRGWMKASDLWGIQDE